LTFLRPGALPAARALAQAVLGHLARPPPFRLTHLLGALRTLGLPEPPLRDLACADNLYLVSGIIALSCPPP